MWIKINSHKGTFKVLWWMTCLLKLKGWGRIRICSIFVDHIEMAFFDIFLLSTLLVSSASVVWIGRKLYIWMFSLLESLLLMFNICISLASLELIQRKMFLPRDYCDWWCSREFNKMEAYHSVFTFPAISCIYNWGNWSSQIPADYGRVDRRNFI